MPPLDQLSSYDYELPRELIAAAPLPDRSASRLMVIHREGGRIEHRQFSELPELLAAGDLLVLNETEVLPARLMGFRVSTGGKWEGLYLGSDSRGRWKLIGQTRGSLRAGEVVQVRPIHEHSGRRDNRLNLLLEERGDGGSWQARPESNRPVLELLREFGTLPLPPYIGRTVANDNDWQRYQTTFARVPGAVAAPTAGLHFTQEVFAECADRGIDRAAVTLHVGIGTFRPIQVEQLQDHRMHAEWYELPAATAAALEATRSRGGRVVAVGTTSVRTLESVQPVDGKLAAWQGTTDLFIRPPWQFQVVDALVTNFHLPKSSLLVMISAFAGYDLVREAYAEAIRERYRFFSYGDAMLIL